MFLVTALECALNASLEATELCLESVPDPRHLRDTLAKSENAKGPARECKEITGRDLGVRFVIADAAGPKALPQKKKHSGVISKTLREQAEKDPTVQQMLKTFRGEIVDVKRVEKQSSRGAILRIIIQ